MPTTTAYPKGFAFPITPTNGPDISPEPKVPTAKVDVPAVHEITLSLPKLAPPLALGETVTAYFAADHDMTSALVKRHAFGVVILLSGGRAVEISPQQSAKTYTNNQRGNLGALLTILEWLELNEAQDHEVTVYTVENFIVTIEESARKKGSKMKDLYELIMPRLKKLPKVRIIRQPDGDPHFGHRKRAKVLAKGELRHQFPPIE